MVKRGAWRPAYDYRQAGAAAGIAYLGELLDKIEQADVVVTYTMRRLPIEELCDEGDPPWGHKTCPADFGEDGVCGEYGRYEVVVRSENTLKGTVTINRLYPCTLRHISRRVRDYFGLDFHAMTADESIAKEEAKERRKVAAEWRARKREEAQQQYDQLARPLLGG